MKKINGIVYLKNYKEEVLTLTLEHNTKRVYAYRYDEETIKESVEAHIIAKLRYNTRTGAVFIRNEKRSWPTHSWNVQTYENIEDILENEFITWIMNGASRINRNYTAIG